MARAISDRAELGKVGPEEYLQLHPFDAADDPDTPEAQAEYIAAAFETPDPTQMGKALYTLARARRIDNDTSRARAEWRSVRNFTFDNRDSRFSTLFAILQSLDVRIHIRVANRASD